MNEQNIEEIYVFGAENDNNIYKYNTITKIFTKVNVYPNKCIPYHCQIFFKKKANNDIYNDIEISLLVIFAKICQ